MDLFQLIQEYQNKVGKGIVNYDQFNQYALVHHSTGIEGSTLTLQETQLLLEHGLTAKGKPLEDHLMVQDHHQALLFVLEKAKEKAPLTVPFICDISALIMSKTGGSRNTALGSYDVSKGEIRKGSITAGGRIFMDHRKVPTALEDLCTKVNDALPKVKSIENQLHLSFDLHFNIVTIHPFGDGNGRLSRLMMNFIQHYFDLPLAIVFQEDKLNYYEALEATRNEEDISIFRSFMESQYIKHLTSEIDKLDQSKKSGGFNLGLMF